MSNNYVESKERKILSIIVPVYNVERYINKCLDSLVLEETELMAQFEVIVVNDGTRDHSIEQCQEYVNRFPNVFRLINKENGGHGSAWNVGLREAKGKYVRFLDSDDWLTNLDVLLGQLVSTDADLVYSNVEFNYEDNGGKDEIQVVSGPKGTVEDISGFDFFSNRFDVGNFWFATYKESMLDSMNVPFLEKCYYDDSLLTILPYFRAKTFLILDAVVYHWRLGRPNQTTAPAVLRKHAYDRLMNHRYLMEVNNKFDSNELSSSVRNGIRWIIAKHAVLLCNTLDGAGFRLQKQGMSLVAQSVDLSDMAEIELPKKMKRYKSLPFPVYFLAERLRMAINRLDA